MKIKQPFWTTPLSRPISYGFLSNRSPSMPKSALLKSKVVMMLFALFASFRILNSIILWSLQPKLPLTFTSMTCSSLFVSNRSNRTSPLIGHLTICVRRFFLTLKIHNSLNRKLIFSTSLNLPCELLHSCFWLEPHFSNSVSQSRIKIFFPLVCQ